MNTIIKGTGSHIPTEIIKNEDFINQDFYSEKGIKLNDSGEEIIQKFHEITGIKERRYLKKDISLSDIAHIAAEQAIKDANIDPETIDQIIVAHNFGDVPFESIQADTVPSLASRVKHKLQIKNPSCVAYDILFGCPGWIQAVIHADAFIKAGIGKRFLVIGAEALSRVSDPYDRDSMIYSDGAGAAIIEGVEENEKRGLLASSMQTDTSKEAYYLYFGESYNPDTENNTKYIKMNGRKIYEYAISKVPAAMKLALDKANIDISQLHKIIIHQANEKMDEAIVKRFYRLYNERNIPKDIMPMSIHLLGNSSVATIPTLYDNIIKGKCPKHQIEKGNILLFASVGAGMSINSFAYRM
ncbi:MAG: 3-oxoacyl-ACP synthase [Bacteroidetes bacterium 4572_77]|nr:MAG: 3-oxoacyl-ACP synthase [Bacteroidetes bacterium 4572_77]